MLPQNTEGDNIVRDREFLLWLHTRLRVVHGENPETDYMIKLRMIAWAAKGGEVVSDEGWSQVVEAKSGTIFEDWYEENVRVLVMRGPSALCAYVGLLKDHPLAGLRYDLILLECHGGLTFSRTGDGKRWPEDYYWYGWDYSHAGDYATYYDDSPRMVTGCQGDKKWTVAEVKEEAKWVAWDFARLMKLAEIIRNNAR